MLQIDANFDASVNKKSMSSDLRVSFSGFGSASSVYRYFCLRANLRRASSQFVLRMRNRSVSIRVLEEPQNFYICHWNCVWKWLLMNQVKLWTSNLVTRLYQPNLNAWTRSSCGFGDGKKHHYLSRGWLFIAINYSNRLLATGKVKRGSRLCYVTSFSFGFVNDVNEKCILCKER